jgi:hypothetical protein
MAREVLAVRGAAVGAAADSAATVGEGVSATAGAAARPVNIKGAATAAAVTALRGRIEELQGLGVDDHVMPGPDPLHA